ncbi:hypothetical protein [Nocardioides mesophilus]|uniref:Uncharacterized protein n=1 Tax=Nocardioides mesophilus TaxID=433659 RepID=A0A7G9RGA9_9ACTN|nr:hypothetical protein [Nocardioides mesophilus]QNN54634.1 hypothetical protein H9L09_10215 [Nocardioides mesophilus]
MADKETGEGPREPDLELPSLFRRRRRRHPQPTSEPTFEPEPEVESGPVAAAAQPRGTSLATEQASRPPAPAPERTRERRRLPVPAVVAAALTGLLVGLLGTFLTWGGLAGCDAVRGTSSCGGGAGLALLLAILAVMVLAGAVLLAMLRVPEPRSTSVLGVGVLCVMALLVLSDAWTSGWMFVVVPLIGLASYALAHWVTSRFDTAPETSRGTDPV